MTPEQPVPLTIKLIVTFEGRDYDHLSIDAEFKAGYAGPFDVRGVIATYSRQELEFDPARARLVDGSEAS